MSASAASHVSKERLDGSEILMAVIAGSGSGASFSKIRTSCPIQTIAASVNSSRSRARSKSR